ncbi:FN3 domain-containing metallophosphoesterase family protein [Phocaeicola oris]|uniref:FN3 domain-containing metallophosphoesterase family protein n=1 Tax=Phocaeicola oris TaxID=2896850 RepID=UPI00234E4431|nr:FN3 domain-containing metallophosphoesterase family protein [Phocaeicola oris]MCE2617114.1 metallophosphoesterase [Phocaeicola oris]
MKRFHLLLFLLCLPLLINAEDIKILHGPYLQNVSETEATIVWEVNNESIGWVELAPNDGTNFYATERPKYFDTKIGIKNTAKLHTVKLTGLKANTVYRYRILAQEVLSHQGIRVHYGDVAASNVYSAQPYQFKTLDTSKPETSFCVINDIHARENIITPLLNNAGYKDKDMVIYNGDMVSQFSNEDIIFTGFMDESIHLFAKEKPFYYIRGNHETRGEYATHFQDYFCPREQNIYFTVHQGPAFFIFLDAGEDKPDNDLEYAGITDYDHYRSEQAEWLEKVVASEEFKNSKFKIIVCHIPPIPIKNAWHGHHEVLNKFVPILNNAGIDIMICGHLHRFLYEDPSTQINFPVLVNSNNSVVSAETKGNQLNVKIYELNGKISFDKTFTAK